MKITYVTGDPASGKTTVAAAIVDQHRHHQYMILVDEGYEVDNVLNRKRVTAPSLLAKVRTAELDHKQPHVVLVGDACKPMLDALLVTHPNTPYFMISTMRVNPNA